MKDDITVPDKNDLNNINTYNSLKQLTILKDICNRIFIARNISMSQDCIIDNLEKIDKLFRTRDGH